MATNNSDGSTPSIPTPPVTPAASRAPKAKATPSAKKPAAKAPTAAKTTAASTPAAASSAPKSAPKTAPKTAPAKSASTENPAATAVYPTASSSSADDLLTVPMKSAAPAAAPTAPTAPTAPAAPAAQTAPAAPTVPPVTAKAEPKNDPYSAPSGTPIPGYEGAQTPGEAPFAPVPAGPSQGLSIASMISGISSIVLSFVFFGFLPGVAAIVMGHMAQKKQPHARPYWLTGLITGYIGAAIGLATGVFFVGAIVLLMAGFNEVGPGFRGGF